MDVIFHPGIGDIYPRDFRTYVEVEGLSQVMCGISRPRPTPRRIVRHASPSSSLDAVPARL